MTCLAGWGTFAALGLACSNGKPRTESPPLTSCRLEGLGVEARCGSLSELEDRAQPDGRRIELHFAVVPALSARPQPDPLFILVGGPGQAATQAGGPIVRALHDVQRSRDIVLLDQRGTGGSHALRCEEDLEGGSLERRFAPRLELEKTERCRAALDADPARYTTDIAMDDLDDLRRTLGYDRINLWGGSYGTRAALVYYRQHPEHVRSLTLDGAAPFAIELPLYVGRDSQRALDLLYADCEKEPDCAATFPAARARLEALLERLGRAPESIGVTHPRSGERESIRVEREGLNSVLLNLLYVPDLAALAPLGVERASQGNWDTLVGAAQAFSDAASIDVGRFLSVSCAEDVARISTEAVDAQTRGTFLGAEWLQHLRQQCAVWRGADLPDSYFAPVTGDVPSLVLSGNIDPVTPPVWGELVASQLSSSRHIVVPGGAHGVSSLGCVPELIAKFVEGADPTALDAACVNQIERPPFFTSLAGPKP
ncbi:MAG TPA: alpha/beta fold hydrolase [Polyangiaceae bacterium]|nr:alpha/beta fold hydrolase [Polyangiaceae bacterium]